MINLLRRIYFLNSVSQNTTISIVAMKINIGQILVGIITFFSAIIVLLLAFRFLLLLFGANPLADFTVFVYDSSDPLIAPFEDVFPTLEAASFTLEISTILAVIVYGTIAFIFIYLARHMGSVTLDSQGKHSKSPMVEGGRQSRAHAVNQPLSQTESNQQHPVYDSNQSQNDQRPHNPQQLNTENPESHSTPKDT